MHGNTYAEGTFANRNIMSQKKVYTRLLAVQ